LLKEGQLYAGFLLAMKSSIKIMFFQLLTEGQLYSGFLLAMKFSIITFTRIQLAFCKQLENIIIEDFIAKRKPA
jgi:hypothetical protein